MIFFVHGCLECFCCNYWLVGEIWCSQNKYASFKCITFPKENCQTNSPETWTSYVLSLLHVLRWIFFYASVKKSLNYYKCTYNFDENCVFLHLFYKLACLQKIVYRWILSIWVRSSDRHALWADSVSLTILLTLVGV